MANQRIIQWIGWAASVAAVIMFFSYIDQVRLNLAGNKGSLIQPAATVINCTLWFIYGFGKVKKDWPIMVANFPGIVLGALAFMTAL